MTLLFHPELLRAALVEDERRFSKEHRSLRVFKFSQGKSVLTTVGEEWGRQRKLLREAFSPKRVAGYLNLMRSAAVEANDAFFPSGTGRGIPFDPSVYASHITMDVMLRVLFSEKISPLESASIRESVLNLSAIGQRMLQWPVVPARWIPFPGRNQLMEHDHRLRTPIRERIERRRSATALAGATPVDLIEAMLLAEEGETTVGVSAEQQRLTPKEVEDNCITLFGAGFETSASALTWWMGFMALHPEHMQRARAEIRDAMGSGWAQRELEPASLSSLHFLEASLKEAMRLRPPAVAVFNRVANQNFTLMGVPFQRGDIVSGSIWTLHHDKRWFPEPNAFNPARFMPDAPPIPRGAFLPFGAGPHVCLGQHFAMLEMKLVAALLLSQFEWAFPPGEKLPDPRVDVTIKPARPFQLVACRIDPAERADF